MPSLEGSPRRRRVVEETPERSTSGWGAVARRQAEIAERRSEMENQVKEFYLKDGESATIQFLHDEPYCYDAHSVRDKNGRFSVVPCQLNTQRRCEMCSRGIKQTWRAAPCKPSVKILIPALHVGFPGVRVLRGISAGRPFRSLCRSFSRLPRPFFPARPPGGRKPFPDVVFLVEKCPSIAAVQPFLLYL